LIIEQGVDAREIECAAIGGWDCELTTAGEIETNVEFYTYEAKYLSTGASTVQIPADLSDQQIKTVQEISRKVYQALELGGMSRIDLFLDRQTGDFYFNEVNTIPGFTSVSQYPQLWAHQGLPPKELIKKLIEHGQQRHATRQQLRRGR
jgi:D-alanine-D-alanine ligase